MYRYKGAGLQNIWILNGYRIENTPYGEGAAVEDVEGLHKAIGLHLIDSKPHLSGAEFRFLRKEMNMSQKFLGQFLGYEDQTIAIWEKNKGKIPKTVDLFVRAIYSEYVKKEASMITKMIKRLSDIDRIKNKRKLVFREAEDGWIPSVA